MHIYIYIYICTQEILFIEKVSFTVRTFFWKRERHEVLFPQNFRKRFLKLYSGFYGRVHRISNSFPLKNFFSPNCKMALEICKNKCQKLKRVI